MYIASDMSQVFHSTNAGVTWSTVNHTELQGNKTSQVQFTNNANILYCLDYSLVNLSDAVTPTKSTDGGLTWTPMASDPTSGGAFYLRADPNNPNNLFVTDWTHLYFSNNGGASFTLKYTTSDTGSGLHIAGAFFDGNNIYIGTNQGLLVSTNGGSSFSIQNITGIPTAEKIVSFAGAKVGGTTRLVATTNTSVWAGVAGYELDLDPNYGVYFLDVGQSSWTKRTSGIPAGNYPFYVGMALNDINTVYVSGASDAGVPVVFKTTNAGTSWSSVFLSTNNQNVQTGWSGQGGDRGWGYGEIAFSMAVAPNDSSRAVFTDFGFAHMTTNGGTLWKALYVDPADLNPAGQNTPTGKNYHGSGLENTTGWQIAWMDANTLIGGNSDIKGQRSTDGGATWSFNYTGNNFNSMYRVVKNPTSGTVYAAVATVHDMYQTTHLSDASMDSGDGEVLFSTNNGAAWQTMHDFNAVVMWVATDPTNANRLYAAVADSVTGGIYVTNNASAGAGSTWTKLSNPPRTEGHAYNIVVLNDGSLVVSYSGRRNSSGAFTASSGVFYSTDGGTTWQDRSASGMQYYTRDVVIDPFDSTQNTWYAGVWSGWGGPPNGLGGLYRTTNRGQSWTRVFTQDRVSSLTINPNDANDAYLTTETAGLWHTSNLTNASPTFTLVANFPFRQPERVFFNPFNQNQIWVTTFGGGFWTGSINQTGPGQLQLSNASYSVNENGGQVTITVTRTGGSTGAVNVNYATANGTATAGSDYTAASGTLNFADGQTSATFTVTILDDSVYEGNENFTVTLSNPTGGATLGSPATGTVTIVDNEQPQPGQFQFSNATYSVNENGGSITITVNRVNGNNGAVSVNYATANGSATAGSDYTAASGTLNFADGQTSATFTVTILDDTIFEGNETFTVALSSPTGGATLGSPSLATVTIVDNEQPQPGQFQFSSATYSVNENGGSITITVNRVNGNNGAVSVNYATANGSATAGSDYTAASGTLNFADGQTSATFTVAILDDSIFEGNETFTVTLSSPTGGATLGSPATATVTIVDNEQPQPGQFQFSNATYSVNENGGSITITVNRVNGNNGAVSVNYATSNGSATAGSDYTAASGTLNFADGQTSATFTVNITDDTIFEGNETFTVSLSSPTGGATLGSPATATVTIVDNEQPQPGQFQFSSATYSVNENGGSITITVNRVNGSNGAVSVNYATANGSATAGSDYTAASGTLNFADGQTSQTFTVNITDDTFFEGNETFTVTLSSPTGGATLGNPATATVTIVDNEQPQPGQFQFSNATYSVNENGGQVTITVTRTNGSNGAVSVNYATANGSASAGADYTAASGTLNFADGQTTQTFTVSILDDAVFEGNETFTVALSSPTGGATLGNPSSATVTIVDNEQPQPGQFQFSNASYSVNESGGQITITVNRVNGSNGAVSVNYATANGSATAGSDYTAASGTLNFADGQTSTTFTVNITDDAIFEGNETFMVALSSPTGGATLGNPATTTVTIVDNEQPQPGQLQFSNATYSVNENGGQVTITVTRTNGSDGPVNVNYATSNGSATAGSDYVAASGTLNFANGQTSQTFTITILDDSAFEGNETVNLTLSSPGGGATLGTPNTAVLTIVDNDQAPQPGQFQLSSAAYSVNENGGSVTITVNRVNGSNGAVSVGYATANGTAIAGNDYTAASGTLNFADGQTSQTFTVNITNDALVEGNETFTVSLSNPTGGAMLGNPVTATVTIIDDDVILPGAGKLRFSAQSFSANEGAGTVTVTVQRYEGSTGMITVQYYTYNLGVANPATAGTDYLSKTGKLVFNTGETVKTFTVNIVQDTAIEADEQFGVALQNPTGGATLGTPKTAAVTILDDDFAFRFSPVSYVVQEGVAFAVLQVQRVGYLGTAASVSYKTMDDTAKAGQDYEATNGALNFAAGESVQTLQVRILEDALKERRERLVVKLLNPTAGGTLGYYNTASLYIDDND
jgi:ribosomal protein L35AE/L33A